MGGNLFEEQTKQGYSFEVAFPAASGIAGVVLADKVKMVPWGIRLKVWIGNQGRQNVKGKRQKKW
jgi:mRNA-degrading endonuclease toxin of MazEF toxin-antitoxin module